MLYLGVIKLHRLTLPVNCGTVTASGSWLLVDVAADFKLRCLVARVGIPGQHFRIGRALASVSPLQGLSIAIGTASAHTTVLWLLVILYAYYY